MIFQSYVSLPEGILVLTVRIESALWIPLGQKLVLKREAISYQDEIDWFHWYSSFHVDLSHVDCATEHGVINKSLSHCLLRPVC